MGWTQSEFESAYRDLAPRAKAIALRVLRDHDAAQDVVQEVFMELWSRPEAFDASRGTLSAYVSMLARCRSLDRLRAASARNAAVERSAHAQAPADLESAADPLLRHERASELIGALREVPAPQAEAIILSYGYGLSTRELADLAAIPLGTAKSRLRLGLRKARAALGATA